MIPYLAVDGLSLSAISAIAVQFAPVRFQPKFRTIQIRCENPGQFPEPGRMVHVDKVRDLVSRQIIQHMGGCQNQPPGKIQRSRRRAGAPAAGLVPKR